MEEGGGALNRRDAPLEALMAGKAEARIRAFSVRDLREMDRLASAEYGMPTLLLMEHAAQALCESIVQGADTLASQRILIVCGPGNNGGDGYAAARLLLGEDIAAHVICVDLPREGTDASSNDAMARSFGVPVHLFEAEVVKDLFEQADIIVDCLLGTGVSRAPEGETLRAIEWTNAARDRGAFVFAADVPSGLDADLGLPLGACVRANVTVSFVGPKIGYVTEAASSQYTGWVLSSPIGMPGALVKRYGQMVKPAAVKPTRAKVKKQAKKAKSVVRASSGRGVKK